MQKYEELVKSIVTNITALCADEISKARDTERYYGSLQKLLVNPAEQIVGIQELSRSDGRLDVAQKTLETLKKELQPYV